MPLSKNKELLKNSSFGYIKTSKIFVNNISINFELLFSDESNALFRIKPSHKTLKFKLLSFITDFGYDKCLKLLMIYS
jgi:hypothetical protein